ncbi:SGNH/GDSL hydrolase family protein [Stenotrophomonas maltophilia]|uniref:SGNH/GDSL hydrolase family protein n=1 Tax=Stenotrophomonas maltophilia TaxID=40324 RepID=UPI001F1DB3C2|nr:GDSL-type esterase/lipase family protein [Stenotrophomonas maltophilia]MCF3524532.1 SGNH/GDSL hydrolase family protein [Stenotrophomonas maltophilia]MCF3553275.1 SGNH/GDSL hydrolase family protein [Stenotrophomonas maltophilia]
MKILNSLAVTVMAAVSIVSCSGESPARTEVGSTASDDCMVEVVRDLKITWPKNQTINIVAFGHSVPAGFAITPEVRKKDAYPRLLEDALADRYPHAVLNVITSGVGGENSTQGLARFQRDVLDHHPRVVLIDFALNDRPLGVEVAKGNLTKIVDGARSAGACPVLLTPTWDEKASPNQPGDALGEQAAMIRGLANELDVPLADSLAAFDAYKGDRHLLMAQFNHPNREGHKIVLSQIMPLFEK